MTRLSTPVSDFRSKRKCFSISGSFALLFLALLAAPAACHPQDEAFADLATSDEYADVDNVEFHDVKIVDGIMHEDHPVIMYKEDFVNEDYDPSKNRSSTEATATAKAQQPRKYKDIAHRRRRLERKNQEQYRALKPEKVYFDVLSPAPIVVSDDAAANDSKFDASRMRVEVIPLIDEVGEAKSDVGAAAGEPDKELLNKRPKKYHRRIRRDTALQSIASSEASANSRTKRAPNIYWQPLTSINTLETPVALGQLANHYLPVPVKPSNTYKYTVAGNYFNGINGIPAEKPPRVENRFGDQSELVIWHDLTPVRDPSKRLNATRRPARPPIISGGAAAGTNSISSAPAASVRPEVQPIFTRPSVNASPQRPRTTTAAPKPQETSVSECVWAIASCCTGKDNRVRYSCFENFGCNAVFWGQNPCADNVRDQVVEYLYNRYDDEE